MIAQIPRLGGICNGAQKQMFLFLLNPVGIRQLADTNRFV
jgi:hypothetical protein